MLPIAPVLPAAPALPPLLLALLLACTAWGLAMFNIIPAPNFLGGMVYLSSLSAVLGVSGAAIIAAAFIQFRLKKTSVNPRQFSKNNTLIVSGVFAFTRNPIYLGMLLMLISWVIYLADLIAAVAPLIFLLWINFWQISVEEIHLQRHFGESYQLYCKRVRRWF